MDALIAATLQAELAQRLKALQDENAALRQTLHDELDENLRLRELGGALPSECMTSFLERVIAERDRMRAAIEEALPFTLTIGQQVLSEALEPNAQP